MKNGIAVAGLGSLQLDDSGGLALFNAAGTLLTKALPLLEPLPLLETSSLLETLPLLETWSDWATRWDWTEAPWPRRSRATTTWWWMA